MSMFSETECKVIEKAIEEAELKCSGEIRVHIDRKCEGDVMDVAVRTFEKLEMHKTQLRNGVLFYFAYETRKFAVLGDAGIDTKVPKNFWDDVAAEMEAKFRKGEFVEGLCNGVRRCGEKLQEFFPYQRDDVNELPNAISFGEE